MSNDKRKRINMTKHLRLMKVEQVSNRMKQEHIDSMVIELKEQDTLVETLQEHTKALEAQINQMYRDQKNQDRINMGLMMNTDNDLMRERRIVDALIGRE